MALQNAKENGDTAIDAALTTTGVTTVENLAEVEMASIEKKILRSQPIFSAPLRQPEPQPGIRAIIVSHSSRAAQKNNYCERSIPDEGIPN